MNGYLNNLTMRTLNTGNRVEPRLPALFEPGAFESGPPVVERTAPLEEEVMTVSEAAPPREKADEAGSSEASSPRPSAAKPEIEDSPVVPRSSSVKSDEEPVTRFEPVHHEDEREEPVESLTVHATVQPRTEAIETPLKVEDPFVESAPIFEEVEELLSLPLQRDDSAMRRPVSTSENQNLSRRTPRRSHEAPPAVLSPAPAPETDEFQAQITFQRTTPQNAVGPVVAPIELGPKEEFSEIELQVANQPEAVPEFEATMQSTFRRANPMPATWRDTRQQQWRRHQSPAPVDSEPSINVTIGRIEVRAVPADSRKTTAPRRSESPVMPLEDYLRKQRRGGER